MKKLFLSLIVMVAFATSSSFAYTYSDNYRVRAYAAEGQQEYLFATQPYGFGYTRIVFIITNTAEYSYASGDSWDFQGCSVSGPGSATVYAPFYAGQYIYVTANAGLGGYSDISAWYLQN